MKNFLQYALALVAVVAIIMWQTGYNPFAGSGKMGEIVTAAEFKTLKKDLASAGKRVALVARGDIANSNMTIVLGRPVSISFMTPQADYIDHFELYRGDGKNEFFIPEKFTNKDLVLYDNDGKKHNYDENVVISFTMEKLNGNPQINPRTGGYDWAYKQIRIDPAPAQ